MSAWNSTELIFSGPTDGWRQSLDNKKDVAVVAIDISKAFDSIFQNLFLSKLKAYGVLNQFYGRIVTTLP